MSMIPQSHSPSRTALQTGSRCLWNETVVFPLTIAQQAGSISSSVTDERRQCLWVKAHTHNSATGINLGTDAKSTRSSRQLVWLIIHCVHYVNGSQKGNSGKSGTSVRFLVFGLQGKWSLKSKRKSGFRGDAVQAKHTHHTHHTHTPFSDIARQQ